MPGHAPDVNTGARPALDAVASARAISRVQPSAPAATASCCGPSQSAAVSTTGSSTMAWPSLPLAGAGNTAGCCCTTSSVAGSAAAAGLLVGSTSQPGWAGAAAAAAAAATAAAGPPSVTRLDRRRPPAPEPRLPPLLLLLAPTTASRLLESSATTRCTTCRPAAISCTRCGGRGLLPAGTLCSCARLAATMLAMLSKSDCGGRAPHATCCMRRTKPAMNCRLSASGACAAAASCERSSSAVGAAAAAAPAAAAPAGSALEGLAAPVSTALLLLHAARSWFIHPALRRLPNAASTAGSSRGGAAAGAAPAGAAPAGAGAAGATIA